MRKSWLVMVAVCGLLCTSCLGPGHATARLYQYNQEFENKWAREGLFIAFLPGYIFTSLGDNLIFNPIQWWTGENPVDPPEAHGPSEFGL
jgi:hypothetical protein